MASKNDKWVMFRNFLFNELKITKEDIREWIYETINQQIQEVLDNTYRYVSIREITESQIKKILSDYDVKNKIVDKVINAIQFKNGEVQ